MVLPVAKRVLKVCKFVHVFVSPSKVELAVLGVAHEPSPLQKVVAPAPVPLFNLFTAKSPVVWVMGKERLASVVIPAMEEEAESRLSKRVGKVVV